MNRTRRRVLFVCNDAAYFRLHWAWRALAVARADFSVAAAIPDDGAPQDESVVRLPIDLDRKGKNPLTEFHTVRRIDDVVRQWKPDLIHSVTAKPNLYAGLIARFRGIPIACSVTGLGSVFADAGLLNAALRPMIMSSYRAVAGNPRSAFLFENDDDRDMFVGAGVIQSERAILLPGVGVDPVTFAYHPEPVDESPIVLLPARLLWSKGVGEFVAAAGLLRRDGVKVRMVIVGARDDGNPAAIPQRQITEWTRSGDVEFWGFRADMPEVLSSATIVCLPSYREGLPRVLLEAAACGRACITTDVPGCRRAVVDGVTGLLVPVRSAEAIANAIVRLLAHAPLRRDMATAGRKRVLEEFTEQHTLDATLEVYERLLATPRGTP